MYKKAIAVTAVTVMSALFIQSPLHASELNSNADKNNIIYSNATTPPGETTYRTESRKVHVSNENNRVYGDSGMTITVKAGEEWTTHGSINAPLSGDIGAILASVQAEVGLEVGIQKTVTTSASASWQVPDHVKRGWVERGNNGYEKTWVKGQIQAPCNWVELDRGSALVVTDQISFRHSEGLTSE